MPALMSAFDSSSGLVVLNLSFVDHDPKATWTHDSRSLKLRHWGVFHSVECKSQAFDNRSPARDLLVDPPSDHIRTAIGRCLESRCDELLLQLLVREGHSCRFVEPLSDRLWRSRGSDEGDVILDNPTGNTGLNPSRDFWRADETTRT